MSSFLIADTSGAQVQTWSHFGWYAGTGLFLLGAASGCLRTINGTLVGGFCSLLFGASLVVFFFSLAYSPYAPKRVVSSVKVERPNYELPRRNRISSDHPVAVYVCLVPGVVGAIAGAVAGSVVWVMYRDEKSSAELT